MGVGAARDGYEHLDSSVRIPKNILSWPCAGQYGRTDPAEHWRLVVVGW